MEVMYETKTERMRQDASLSGMRLTLTYPIFTYNGKSCPLPTESYAKLSDSIVAYFKNSLRHALSQSHGTRFPIDGSIEVQIFRMDEKILSFRLAATACMRRQTLYEKCLYFLYTNAGSSPLSSKAAVKGNCRCLYIEGNTATDPLTKKNYPLREKYRI